MRNLRSKQRGFATAYLLVAIVLFSLVAWEMSQMYDANQQVRWAKTSTDLIYDQALLIRTQVIACGTSYPSGVNTDPNSLSYYKKYPGSSATLDTIQCPGAPAGQQLTWGGRDGVFLRKLPSDFTSWSYTNGSAGITVSLNSTTSRGHDALARLVTKFNANEASMSGNRFTFVVANP